MSYRSYKFWLKLSVPFLLCCIGVLCGVSFTQKKWEKLIEGGHPHALPFLSVFFFDSNNGIAVTTLNLQKTNDAGKTWTVQLENAEKAFYSIAFTSPTTGFIVGMERKKDGYVPMVVRTEDSGNSWQESSISIIPRIKADITPRLQSISFCNEKVGWAAGMDLILHTTDRGRTWEVQRSGNSDESLFSIQCVSHEMAWVVGQDGLILHTKDSGKSWSRQEGGTKATLLRVRSFGDSGWVLGLDGTLLRTRDGGAKWEQQRLALTGALFDIHMDGQQGWIVGAEGTILHSKDGGQTWQRYESLTNNDLVSLFFLSPKQGWAGGDRRTLLRFSD